MYFGRILSCFGKCQKGVVKCDTLLKECYSLKQNGLMEISCLFGVATELK